MDSSIILYTTVCHARYRGNRIESKSLPSYFLRSEYICTRVAPTIFSFSFLLTDQPTWTTLAYKRARCFFDCFPPLLRFFSLDTFQKLQAEMVLRSRETTLCHCYYYYHRLQCFLRRSRKTRILSILGMTQP